MIKLIKIKQEELRQYVALAFNGDAELLVKYHVSPGDLDHCVDHTMGFINTNADFYKDDIEFYCIENEQGPIGYTVIIRNEGPGELYSFGINLLDRDQENKTQWLAEVKKLLGTPYGMVLWSRNERAIKFFEKNGFTVHRTSKLLNDETKTLITIN